MVDSTSPASQITQLLSTPPTETNKEIMGRDDFLQVLMTQLRYQDPLEPLSQTEMIGQLTQFNMLDELRGMNSAITDSIESDANNVALLAALQQAVINGQSVGLIGKNIEAEYSSVTVGDGEVPTYTLDAPEGSSSVTVSVLDSSGTTVASETLAAGTVEFQPPVSGLPAGTYELRAETTGSDGTSTTIPVHLSGLVSALRFGENGTVLEVEGQEISLADIIGITTASE
jgi:flagellar basal-body rod modification protein FlgD